MDIFSDDGAINHDKLELARKAIAEAGGSAVGNGASHIKDKQDAHVRQAKASDAAHLTALQIALQDEGYRRLYDSVWNRINETQDALDQAMLENAETIERLEDDAMRTEDGRMIFVSDGGFVYADGSAVDPDDAPAPYTISEDATRWDDYVAAIDRRETLSRVQTDTLDPIRDRMNDPDNPPDKPTMKGFEDQLDKADREISGHKVVAPTSTSANNQISELGFAIPEPA